MVRRCTVRVVLLVSAIAAFGAEAHATPSVSKPTCNRSQARIATNESSLGAKMRRDLGSPLNASYWGIASFHCARLRTARELDMVVEFDCCTANSPTPIGIFRPEADSWHLGYSWAGEPPVYSVELRGKVLTGRTPVYDGGPLCCPSGSRSWSVRWNGRRWAVKASHNEGRL